MANPDYGFCNCPVCQNPLASVRIAANKKAYTSCDECLSSTRTLSGQGDRKIRSWITELVDPNKPATEVKAGGAGAAEAAPPAAEGNTAAPAAKRGGFSDALDVLTGGKRG